VEPAFWAKIAQIRPADVAIPCVRVSMDPCNRYLGTGLSSSVGCRSRCRRGQVRAMTWVPESCTLPTVEQPLRVAEFDDLFATAVAPTERVGTTGLRIHLPAGDPVVSTVGELVDRETACCSFFSFDVRASSAETELEVRVPESQAAVLDAMQQRAEAARAGGVRE
jgi:hypothetical protein